MISIVKSRKKLKCLILILHVSTSEIPSMYIILLLLNFFIYMIHFDHNPL